MMRNMAKAMMKERKEWSLDRSSKIAKTLQDHNLSLVSDTTLGRIEIRDEDDVTLAYLPHELIRGMSDTVRIKAMEHLCDAAIQVLDSFDE